LELANLQAQADSLRFARLRAFLSPACGCRYAGQVETYAPVGNRRPPGRAWLLKNERFLVRAAAAPPDV